MKQQSLRKFLVFNFLTMTVFNFAHPVTPRTKTVRRQWPIMNACTMPMDIPLPRSVWKRGERIRSVCIWEPSDILCRQMCCIMRILLSSTDMLCIPGNWNFPIQSQRRSFALNRKCRKIWKISWNELKTVWKKLGETPGFFMQKLNLYERKTESYFIQGHLILWNAFHNNVTWNCIFLVVLWIICDDSGCENGDFLFNLNIKIWRFYWHFGTSEYILN